MHEPLDLEQAGQLIDDAQDGILFLMFNPGPRGTLLNDIIELASPSSQKFKPNLYIQGVVNQNPGTAKSPVILFNRGDRIDANADVVLPAAIPGVLKFWQPELLKLPQTHAMVHSKVVVIDPYGANPVVMTGSHNMGPKASGVNDENLILIQGNRDLASQYAGKIMEIYSQYRWRASVQADQGKPKWQGLADDENGRSRIQANLTTSGDCANSISGSERHSDRRRFGQERSIISGPRDPHPRAFNPTSPTEGVGRRQAAEILGMQLQRSALQGMSAQATSRLFRVVIFGGG